MNFEWLQPFRNALVIDGTGTPASGPYDIVIDNNRINLAAPFAPLLAVLQTRATLRGGAPEETVATTDYGGPVAAVVSRGNVAGTQFHVEKSAGLGLRVLANFLRWEP